jgi:acyl-[acyl-carrier-protein]-phospholipid O-acyltransferase / long-chain-fatty-acid--[acyl-carrier-protein] ligase
LNQSTPPTRPTFEPERTRRTVTEALLDARERVGGPKTILEDHDRTTLTYDRLILAASVLGRKIASFTQPGEYVGFLLPNSVGASVTFFGLQFTHRVPAMLNFTAGANTLNAACSLAGIKTILTSRKFVEAGKFEDLIARIGAGRRIVYLEDLREGLSTIDKLSGAGFSRILRHIPKPSPDAPATILFTSGAEGAPKAVSLSHANLVANAEQIRAHIALDLNWVFFSPLPIFHCFGLTGGLLLPLLTGMRTFQYPSPLHHKLIPQLVKDSKANVLLATDTFLAQYARAADKDELSTLKFAVCGAERVRDETRRMMQERFGVPIVEGYGATEMAPVISVNQPEQNRPGTVGKPLPGIECKIVPVDGIDEGGRLLLRGPNMMHGYLEPGGAVTPPKDGWHDTGDVVTIDAEGFITIAGRLRRFAKIAGEMVSLNAVENFAASVWPDSAHAAVVLSDDRRGEQVILLTVHPTAERSALQAAAKSAGVPEIQLPRRIIHVDSIPLLGTGKTDYISATALAKEALLGAHAG